MSNSDISIKNSIDVDFFFSSTKKLFNLKLLSKQVGFDRLITEQNIHRPGLALAGFHELFSYKRIQLFGNTEMKYLIKLNKNQCRKSLEAFFNFEIPCIIVTNGIKPLPDMIELAEKSSVPIFGTDLSTTKAVYFLSDFLDDQFAPRQSIHGSFVDVYGIGMLFIGKSGVGKSEVALDLIERGHRLVADDVVILTKKGEGILIGSGTDLVKHFMEVRGIGIIDVRSMFGVRAIRYQKRLEIVIELEVWDSTKEYTRTGLDTETLKFIDVDIPYMRIPIVPGKNLTVIAEVIALNYLLKHHNYDAAKIFAKRLNHKLKKQINIGERAVNYFEHDFE
ncbi:MAG: HPr kinase/phosphorylase [Ignavibacteriales bacterium CG_4_9_14_3_um_filter_34_10]|nr:MAG: HPr kinase/phosphorylase [Ignavibacteriales bacterium CG_4_9_14_3_um_filter_34_10]